MLTSLSVNNIALVSSLQVDFAQHFCAITGETGAGKSVLLNSLSLCLGDRMEQTMINPFADTVEVKAQFATGAYTSLQAWLKERQLPCGDTLTLGRVWKSGVTKSYLNDKQVPLSTLGEIGDFLVDIHGQGAHHLLGKKDTHARLLDAFAGAQGISKEVATLAKRYQALDRQIQDYQNEQRMQASRLEWLDYQLTEMAEFPISEERLKAVAHDFERLSSAQHNIALLTKVCESIQPSDFEQTHALLPMLTSVRKSINELQGETHAQEIDERLLVLEQELTDLADTVRAMSEDYPSDMHDFATLEVIMSTWLKIAHKHQVEITELAHLQEQLRTERETLAGQTRSLETLQTERNQVHTAYLEQATLLSDKRTQAIEPLTQAIQTGLADLHMGNMIFHVGCYSANDTVQAQGKEIIEFLMAPGLNYPLKPITKVASGGELSRISLVIQVALAQVTQFGTVIFDEVDVGIGGSVAEKVGQFLRTLSEQSQVICITHQAQVAAHAHTHYQVVKNLQGDTITTHIERLVDDQRVVEIARMLSGSPASEEALRHATVMLETGLQ